MWEKIGQLQAHHAAVPIEFQVLKLAEEVGEAAEALTGMRGLNRRKGVHRTSDDLLDELADVIITAAVAMTAVTDDFGRARLHFERHLAAVTERAGLQGRPGWCRRALPFARPTCSSSAERVLVWTRRVTDSLTSGRTWRRPTPVGGTPASAESLD